jgi:hypothetical protein
MKLWSLEIPQNHHQMAEVMIIHLDEVQAESTSDHSGQLVYPTSKKHNYNTSKQYLSVDMTIAVTIAITVATATYVTMATLVVMETNVTLATLVVMATNVTMAKLVVMATKCYHGNVSHHGNKNINNNSQIVSCQ